MKKIISLTAALTLQAFFPRLTAARTPAAAPAEGVAVSSTAPAAAEENEAAAGPAVPLGEVTPLPAPGPARAKTEKTFSAWLLGGRPSAAESKAWTGSASVLAAAALRRSERLEFLPLYKGYYQYTRQSYELAGGPVLVQHRMEHHASVKAIYDPPASRQRFKLNAAFTAAYLKEANDEKLGDGLFDYTMPAAGAEWEYFYRKGYSLRAGYNCYFVNFPNYVSLAGQSGNTQVLELRGARVLNSANHAFTAGINGPIERLDGAWDVYYTLTLKRYPDQPLISSAGLLTGGRRRDLLHSLTFASRAETTVSRTRKLISGLDAGASWLASNQNHFDAYENRFVPDFYSYAELRVSPYATLYLGKGEKAVQPPRLSLSAEWTARYYQDRLTQNQDGSYAAKLLRQRGFTLDASLTWPLSARFSARGAYRLYADTANMRYSDFYRYNYTNQEFLAGIGYEF